ncbi:hypothetical protein H257_18126 [Aphanomyces astaci]|uniref:Thioredoxin domain-containing protein n=1 Tax=Aphanomyces astaci TaxID=112090 RepID=W4FC76_APHAT|nr:hypothetical protein H257_18126 [Aphanomyces astaci]ETV65077.1 hypothetical protein H257_18126 [Aphanomyces astaci]|eukprot:XP_009845436.1 hypothetical protein H257_18126 [Aphanomyces astaci]
MFIFQFTAFPASGQYCSMADDDPTADIASAKGIPTLEELLGPEILTTEGVVPTEEALAGNKVIGIYFAAYWCPPCRSFTPIVSRLYEDLADAHTDIEIVFVSCDRTQEQFDEYWGDYMTFPALPYEPRSTKTDLGKRFGVKFIPTLIFLDAETKEIITRSGVDIVEGGVDEQDYVASVRDALGLEAAVP